MPIIIEIGGNHMKKYKLKVELKKSPNGSLSTISVWDNRTQSYWKSEQIRERGILDFLDKEDCKQSLNWNLNGDVSKYKYKEKGDNCFALIYPTTLRIVPVKEYIAKKSNNNNIYQVINVLSKHISDPIVLLKDIADCFPEVMERELAVFLD